MALFCMTMALLYTFCAENSIPVTDAIFGVKARTRAQPRAHTIVKVNHGDKRRIPFITLPVVLNNSAVHMVPLSQNQWDFSG